MKSVKIMTSGVDPDYEKVCRGFPWPGNVDALAAAGPHFMLCFAIMIFLGSRIGKTDLANSSQKPPILGPEPRETPWKDERSSIKYFGDRGLQNTAAAPMDLPNCRKFARLE